MVRRFLECGALVVLILFMGLGARAETGGEDALERVTRERDQALAELQTRRAELDAQFTELDALADRYDAHTKRLNARIALLHGQLSILRDRLAECRDVTIRGGNVPLSFVPPDGLEALEVGHEIHLSDSSRTARGLIRMFADESGAPLPADRGSVAYLLEEVWQILGIEPGEDAPTVRNVGTQGGEGVWFSYEFLFDDGGEGRGEVCILRGARGYYCLELEGARAREGELRTWMGQLIDAAVLYGEDGAP